MYTLQRTTLRIGVLSRASTMINGTKYKLSAGQDPQYYHFSDDISMSFKNNEERIRLQWQDVVFYGPRDTLEQLERNQRDVRLTRTIATATHYIGPPKGLSFATAVAMGIPVVQTEWLDDNSLDLEDFIVKYSKPSSLLKGVAVVVIASVEDKLRCQQLKILVELLEGQVLELSSTDNLVESIRSKVHGESIVLFSAQKSDSLSKIANDYNSELLNADKLVAMVLENTAPHRFLSLPVKREPEHQSSGRRRKKFKKAGLMDFFDFTSSSQLPPQDDSFSAPISSPIKESNNPIESIDSLEPTKIKQEPAQDAEPVNRKEELHTLQVPALPPTPIAKPERSPSTAEIQHKELPKKHSLAPEISEQETKRARKIKPQISFYDAVKATKEEATEQIKNELGLEIDNDDVDTKLSNLVIVETVDIQMRKPRNEKASPLKSRYNKKNFKKFKKNIKLKSRITRSFVGIDDIPANGRITELQHATGVNDEDPEEKMAHDFEGLLNEVSGYNPEKDKLTEYNDGEEESFSFKSGNGLFIDEDSQPGAPTPTMSKKSISKRKQTKRSEPSLHAIPNDDEDDDDDVPSFSFRRSRR